MREYRYYNSIKWGPRYNPESAAHHVRAADYADLREIIPPSTASSHSIQVCTVQGWQWITEVPVHLGGITRHWHGEAV